MSDLAAIERELIAVRSENRAYRSWVVHLQHTIASLASCERIAEAHRLAVDGLVGYGPYRFAAVVEGDAVVLQGLAPSPGVQGLLRRVATELPRNGSIHTEEPPVSQETPCAARWLMAGVVGLGGRVDERRDAVLVVGHCGDRALSEDEEDREIELFATLLVAMTHAYSAIALREGLVDERNRLASEVQGATVELQRALDNAREARDMALAASRSKSQFLANMSHELRTPLNAVIGYGELLADCFEELEPDEIRADLGRILGAARHQLALVDDILDLSRVEAGHLSLVRRDLAVGELFDGVSTAIRPMAEKNRNRLTFHLEDRCAAFQGDDVRLRQVLMNVVGNACKFTRDGEVDVTVAIAEAADGRYLQVEVRDTGIGMSNEQQAQIFEPFVQGGRELSIRYGGTGLGLALCRRICDLMGGTIAVSSTLGVGSTFELRLPAPPLDDL